MQQCQEHSDASFHAYHYPQVFGAACGGDCQAEIIRSLFNTIWLVTMARKSVPKDVGNDKSMRSIPSH